MHVVTVARYHRILHVLGRRQPDLTVLAEHVHKPHNLSAMLRSCDAVGIGTVHAVNPTGGIPTYSASSASAEKWVELKVHTTLDDAHHAVRRQGMQIVAAHPAADAVDYRDIDYTGPTCILFGNERSGVTPKAQALADARVSISMHGMVKSLNVSVAAAVILFEAQRQRREAGLYREPRLTAEEMHVQAFLWLYPKQARKLLERGEPLPPLNDNGEILADPASARDLA